MRQELFWMNQSTNARVSVGQRCQDALGVAAAAAHMASHAAIHAGRGVLDEVAKKTVTSEQKLS
jgi:hypothetical protein